MINDYSSSLCPFICLRLRHLRRRWNLRRKKRLRRRTQIQRCRPTAFQCFWTLQEKLPKSHHIRILGCLSVPIRFKLTGSGMRSLCKQAHAKQKRWSEKTPTKGLPVSEFHWKDYHVDGGFRCRLKVVNTFRPTQMNIWPLKPLCIILASHLCLTE